MNREGTAKARLIANLKTFIEELEANYNMMNQMNASAAWETLEAINALNLVQAHKLEKAIRAAEQNSIESDKKYGFGVVVVSPMDYTAFLNQI